MTSTPAARTGRESPETFNIAGHISPVRETGEMVPSTSSTEQGYEVPRQTASTRGEWESYGNMLNGYRGSM